MDRPREARKVDGPDYSEETAVTRDSHILGNEGEGCQFRGGPGETGEASHAVIPSETASRCGLSAASRISGRAAPAAWRTTRGCPASSRRRTACPARRSFASRSRTTRFGATQYVSQPSSEGTSPLTALAGVSGGQLSNFQATPRVEGPPESRPSRNVKPVGHFRTDRPISVLTISSTFGAKFVSGVPILTVSVSFTVPFWNRHLPTSARVM